MNFESENFNMPAEESENIGASEAETLDQFAPIEGEGRLEMVVGSILEEFPDVDLNVEDILGEASLSEEEKDILREKATSIPTLEILEQAKNAEDKIRTAIQKLILEQETAAA